MANFSKKSVQEIYQTIMSKNLPYKSVKKIFQKICPRNLSKNYVKKFTPGFEALH